MIIKYSMCLQFIHYGCVSYGYSFYNNGGMGRAFLGGDGATEGVVVGVGAADT